MGISPFLPEIEQNPATISKGDNSAALKDWLLKTNMWLEGAYEEAKYDVTMNEDVKDQNRYIEYFMGKQWPAARPSYRSSPVDNRVWRLVWELVSLLTDIRPTYEVRTGNNDYKQQADIVNKTVRSWWLSSDSDMMLAFIILYSILTTGYGKLAWNPDLKQGLGDFELKPIGPLGLLCLKPVHTVQSSQAVIEDCIKPLGWVKKRFPITAANLKADVELSRYSVPSSAPSHMPTATFEVLSPQMQRVIGGPPQTVATSFPMVRYREFWTQDWTINESNVVVTVGPPDKNWSYKVKPGELLYPRGRLFIKGGRELLHDGPNPYWHGMYPYDSIRLNAVPWQFLGASELRPLIPLQDIINNTLAGVLDMIRKAVNPPFITPKNAFPESVMTSLDWSMPGAKAAYSQLASHKPEWMQVPQLPAFVMQVVSLAAREMDQSSGVAAVDEAVRKNQVPGGDTLEQIREAKQTPIRLKGRNIEVFLRTLGQMQVFNVFQFYGIRRRMFMFGAEGLVPEDFDWDPGTMVPDGQDPCEFARNFSFVIQQGSLLNVNRVEKAAILQRLRLTKDIDRRSLYAGLDLDVNVDTVEKNLKAEALEQAGIMAQSQLILKAAQIAAQAGDPKTAEILKALVDLGAPPITVTGEPQQQAGA